MLSVFLTVLPVFLILGCGYLVGRLKYLPDNVADALNAYALRIATPTLLFMAMATLDFSAAFQLPMLSILSCRPIRHPIIHWRTSFTHPDRAVSRKACVSATVRLCIPPRNGAGSTLTGRHKSFCCSPAFRLIAPSPDYGGHCRPGVVCGLQAVRPCAPLTQLQN